MIAPNLPNHADRRIVEDLVEPLRTTQKHPFSRRTETGGCEAGIRSVRLADPVESFYGDHDVHSITWMVHFRRTRRKVPIAPVTPRGVREFNIRTGTSPRAVSVPGSERTRASRKVHVYNIRLARSSVLVVSRRKPKRSSFAGWMDIVMFLFVCQPQRCRRCFRKYYALRGVHELAPCKADPLEYSHCSKPHGPTRQGVGIWKPAHIQADFGKYRRWHREPHVRDRVRPADQFNMQLTYSLRRRSTSNSLRLRCVSSSSASLSSHRKCP